MISRRQIIESQQKLNAQRLLLEKQQQQQSKQQQQQQNSKSNIMSNKSQNSRQALTKMNQQPEEIVVPKSLNKSRQLGKSKQFCVEQGYDVKLAQDMRRFNSSNKNKCFHDDNYAHHHEELEEGNDENEDELEIEGDDNIDEDDEDEFRAQDINKHRTNSNHNCLSHDNNLSEDYRHFDPYSVYGEEDEEEDIWYSEERLFEDHIQEIIDKWLAIDDEIWAKIICMERNRRIAKAYARKHSLTVNGSQDEYLDGTTLGLNSFENQDRDTKTRHIKQYIGQGLRIKITQNGDILVKRLSKANVFVHKIDHKSFGISERLKGSSSDLYALNSESGDLYGVVGPLNRNCLNHASNNGESAFSTSTNSFVNNTFRELQNNHMKKQLNSVGGGVISSSSPSSNQNKRLLRHDHKMITSNISSSDASTSSSSGGVGSSLGNNNAFYRDKNNCVNNHKIKNTDNHQLLFNNKTTSSENANHLMTNFGSIVLDYNKPMKIFDMGKFKSMLEHESRLPYPNRKLLQSHCISIISFVVDDRKMLNLPSWIMIINIVAIDLLKIELGLVDPNLDGFTHSSTNINNSSVLLYDPLVDRRRFGYHLSDYNNKTTSIAMSDSTATVAHSHYKTSSQQQQQLNQRLNHFNNHLAASKKAFANAAALGAYNGDHYNHQHRNGNARNIVANELKVEQQSQKRYLDLQQSNIRSCEKLVETSSNINDQDSDLELIRATDAKLSKQTESEVQQSSSSSGFNSHCSSQNDSSVASSSSNIASGLGASNLDEPASNASSSSSAYRVDEENEARSRDGVIESAPALKPSMFKHLSKTTSNTEDNVAKNCSNLTNNQSNSNINQLSQCPRGKRPPKLPHRVAAEAATTNVSEPIPIPAPPTSSIGGPSGKANLILVSPTGLSPPLPKRKGVQKGLVRSSSQIDLTCDEHSILPEFSMIKHIDENGKCSVLNLDQYRQANKGKLPAGIPAHAQLAPPATQRHILRYLMSATRGKFASSFSSHKDGNSKIMNEQLKFIPPSPVRYQRPLPILPNQKIGVQYNGDRPEENLYYCGLQARVPNQRRLIAATKQLSIPPPKLPPSTNPISQDAINAILTDFKRNSMNYQYCQNDYLKQKFLPTNTNPDSHYLYHKFQKNHIDSPKSSTGSSVTKPLIKFFKTSSSNNSNNNNNSSSNSTTITTKTKNKTTNGDHSSTATSMCLSVDNIHKKTSQKSSQSILGQALKFKKSKVKQTPTE